MNKVILMGNLTRDVEIKEYANDTTVARAGIAVNRPFKNKEVDFFNLVAFNKTAEFLSKYFAKGSKILVEGYLRVSNYEGKDGIFSLDKKKKSSIITAVEFVNCFYNLGGGNFGSVSREHQMGRANQLARRDERQHFVKDNQRIEPQRNRRRSR